MEKDVAQYGNRKKPLKIVSTSMKDNISQQLINMARITGEKYHELEHIGVLGGQAGVSLFQFYCAQYFDEDTYSEKGVDIISNCIEKINEGYAYPTYCNGIAGFGWTLQHLVDHEFVVLNLDELLTPFDQYLFNQMLFEFGDKHYDLLHGALGYGVYFLKRLNSATTSKKNKRTYHSYLIQLLDQLEKMAIEDDVGLKWESTLDIHKGNKGFNLSLSHGMSSIVYLLTKMYHSAIEKQRVAHLVKGAVQYIMQYQRTDEKGLSLFPSWVESNVPVEYNSRVAWCYGDIGVGKALEWGGKVLNDGSLKQLAKDTLLTAGQRRTPNSSMVRDAGYCHGSFGNAHIFHQLGTKYNEKQFMDTAFFWMKDGLARKTDDTDEPYRQWAVKAGSWEFSLGLLEGLSGIGLSIIDFLSEEEHTWDECLLLR
ncbi:MAG: lanthionine synthetase C family protein [Bacteroidota bacterium]